MNDPVYRSVAGRSVVEAAYRAVLTKWPVPHEQLRIATREGETFVITCGPVGAPPLVLLHGSQANSAAWLPDIARWSSAFRIYAIDMIGEPGLSAPSRPPLDGEYHALWLNDVFASLGLAGASIVGTSLGGWLALDYASRRPAFAKALVLISPAGIGRQRDFLAKAMPLMLLGPWGKRKVRELVFGPALDTLPEDLKKISGLMELIGASVRPRVISIPRLSDAQLAELPVPILALVGGRDALIDSGDTRTRLRRCTPNVEVCYFDDGYHFLPDLSERVMSFLNRDA